MDFTYPSVDFPAPCGITLSAPDAWLPDPKAPATMVLFDSQAPDAFRTNVTVNIDRVDSLTSLDDVAVGSAYEMSAEPGYEVQGEERVELDGHPALLRIQTFEADGYPAPLFQAQCLVMVPTANSACADLVIAHATCSSLHAEAYGPVFREIFDSMRFSISE